MCCMCVVYVDPKFSNRMHECGENCIIELGYIYENNVILPSSINVIEKSPSFDLFLFSNVQFIQQERKKKSQNSILKFKIAKKTIAPCYV